MGGIFSSGFAGASPVGPPVIGALVGQTVVEQLAPRAASSAAGKIDTGAAVNNVITSEATTSATYVALATAQAVSVTVGPSGVIEVEIHALTPLNGLMTFELSGANTLTAADEYAIGGVAGRIGSSYTLVGLTPGVTVVTAKFKSTNSPTSAAFAERKLSAKGL